MKAVLRTALGAFVLFHLVYALQYCASRPDEAVAPSPRVPQYLGSESCQSCHATEYADWMGSHHQRAMQHAADSTVLGSFDDVHFESRGVRSHFFRQNGKFMVNTQGPDSAYHDYEVLYTFGLKPLQQYLVQFPQGRMQALRTAWDTEQNRWFDLYPQVDIDPGEWLHWGRGAMNWNTMCADCHSTQVDKNFDPASESYQTRFAEVSVGCEACHGPGETHVKAMQSGAKDYAPEKDLYLTAGLSSRAQVDQCARCHARRQQLDEPYDHSGQLLDHYLPEILRDDLYHPDGQIDDEDYVYGSFVQSKMYHQGVKCSDCHQPHRLELKLTGNVLCLQCHNKEQLDGPQHHFHPRESAGATCVNCHMPGKYYMGNDFRRDHSFRVPRPDQSVAYGAPNACTGCHQDQTDEWASAKVRQWYGPQRKPHFPMRSVWAAPANPRPWTPCWLCSATRKNRPWPAPRPCGT
ncbi:MAG: hypothetical protein HC842_09750 [Cytophagales bacterium]|nr:hypothetical protein [Cytophagales bacterium]